MYLHALLSGLCNAVPEAALSLLTSHVVNNSALTRFHMAKGGALEVLMLMAGFGPGLDHRSFSCMRHLLTSSDIQSAHPEIWALISAQLRQVAVRFQSQDSQIQGRNQAAALC